MATAKKKAKKKADPDKPRRAHRKTGKPVGRPRIEARRYGPEQETQQDIEDSNLPIRMDMHAMNEGQLRSFATAQYGRRYAEDDSIDFIRDDLMRRSDVGRYARNL